MKNSKSNYNFTPFSIASTFNMQYLKNVDQYLPRTKKNFYIGKLIFQNNILFEALKSSGYTINVHSFLYNDDQLNNFGIFAPGNRQNWLRAQTMERVYVEPWLLNSIANLFRKAKKNPAEVNKSLQHCLDYNDQALQNILNSESNRLRERGHPIFNYTHFLLPHDPYLYDENGSPKMNADSGNEMDNYLQQVKYANVIIRKIVTSLLMDSAREKVIIIQGDHGFRNFSNSIPFQEQYKNFNAIYFSTKKYDSLSANPGMINTYRIVMNTFFSTNLPMLKDSVVLTKRSFASETESYQNAASN